MRRSYGVIIRPELPVSSGLHHPEDLEDYDVVYLSWRINMREHGSRRAIWVDEKQETLIKRFQNVYTAQAYLEKHEPCLLELGCYASEIELEEFQQK